MAQAGPVVAKGQWHRDGLFACIGFVVPNIPGGEKPVTHFYNRRCIAEQWLKEHKPALNWTRLSCHHLDDNQAWGQRFVLAYNRGKFLRRLALPASVQHWPLTTPGVNLIKTGAKMVHHPRYVTFQMVELVVPQKVFAAILARIQQFAAISTKPAPI